MADPMRIRAKLTGDVVEVKVLMSHPMETGLRKDGDGNVVMGHYITKVTVTCNEREVMSADWGPAVSKNPFLALRFKGAAVGDTVRITWVDTAGETRTDEAKVG
ncbi:MAG TPA: thiosulfate oxidation carrier complex protein SoxZ [Chiayiivirga sp.]|uniref:Thiosulfate oxidation carrier complex protein SoxZ n=1 Tax=Denitratimonas tolerans TaxID=1338420 RepID=A0AAW9QXR5_9GAMM|nr:thiosulfate oxidation carrier complex protein SoxZ [Xanthomonadaceae bacterium]MDX9763502.1 thiosulfate oxidation carrier complex protein SoxZ [Chiayiivirga sp.]MEB2315836.1 thiosulfate oxidation carrier complex protein SoxZ [Xanthomonadaceae bacterium]HMN34767.1 thiosulfate oxidation carrier complex protein SoxZ [Chiayiivirga sp.]HRN59475.1 thiosulfate oxidation carrier complex protein SoxZ [Chiayiivirga sp.]